MELWTTEHTKTLLPALGVMIVIAIVLRLILKNKDLKTRMIPLKLLACAVLMLEISKQGLSLWQGYDLYDLPFHFCSLFIFALPVMAFYQGKHQQRVYAVVSALCGSVFLLMMIYPNLIYSAGNINHFFANYMDFHTVVFHNIVLFAFVLIVALGVHTPQKKGESKTVAIFTVCFCVVSATMAQLLSTNYNNFYSCNIPVLEQVRLSLQSTLGYGLTQALYVLVVTVLDILFVQLAYWFYRLLHRMASKT